MKTEQRWVRPALCIARQQRTAPPRRTASVALLAGVLLLCGATLAGVGAPAPPEKPLPPGVVNMEFRDTELPTVLRAICRGAGLDFVLDPAIEGKVTAKLRNTTWEKALDIILKGHGLEAKRQGDTLVISRAAAPAPGPGRPDAKRCTVTAHPDGSKLDIDASGADVRDVLRELAAVTKMNIVADKEVSGTVTASLRGLAPDEALKAIADSCGATVDATGKVVRVVPRPPEAAKAPDPKAPARVPEKKPSIEVKKLPDGRLSVQAKDADIRDLLARVATAAAMNIVAAPVVKGSVTLSLDGVSPDDLLAALAIHSGLTFRPMGKLIFAAPAPAPIQTETFRLRYADAKELAEVLQKALPEAKTAFEKATNMVIVVGTADEVATAKGIIEQVEVAPIQVRMETRILETNLTADRKVGIDWSEAFTVKATTPTIPHTWPLKHGTVVKGSSYRVTYDPSDTRSREGMAVPYASPDDFQFGFLTSSGLTAVLNMLQKETKARMLACPSVTVCHNQEATINDVTKFPIAQYQVSSETGLLTISGFEYQEFGTILKVRPRVIDGSIIMDVRPEISREAGTTLFAGAELPIIRSQYTETQVVIKDGHTLVIGGLIREDTETVKSGIPVLSSIPFIGPFLFGSRHKTVKTRRQLLIFITPIIVKDVHFTDDAALQKKRTEPLPDFEAKD